MMRMFWAPICVNLLTNTIHDHDNFASTDDFVVAAHVAFAQIHISGRAHFDPVQGFARQFLFDLGGGACGEHAWWDFRVRYDDAAGGDPRLFADLDVVQKRHIPADDRAAFDQRTFHDGAVADGAVVFDDRRRLARMKHAVVLDAGPGADHDGILILVRPDDSAPPDARFIADGDIADDDGGGRDEGGGRDFRLFAFVFDDHRGLPSNIRSRYLTGNGKSRMCFYDRDD